MIVTESMLEDALRATRAELAIARSEVRALRDQAVVRGAELDQLHARSADGAFGGWARVLRRLEEQKRLAIMRDHDPGDEDVQR